MSFFKRIFSQSDPLASVRKSVGQRRWADALAIGQALDRPALDPDAVEELDQLLESAGDSLAELNLEEGEGCLRCGDKERAAEHFTLAAAQVRSDHLGWRIIQARKALGSVETRDFVPTASDGSDCGSDCCDNGRAVSTDMPTGANLDESTRLELVMGTYPPEMAAACLESSDIFRRAFLLAHEGREKEAAELFERIPEKEKNELYHFEFGAVLGRLGEVDRACRELETALAFNGNNTLALETLTTLEIAEGRVNMARKRLESLLENGREPAFCHGGLAALYGRIGNSEKALFHGLKAVEAGNADPQILFLTASLLEKLGRVGEAETILRRIPGGGGCSGGNSIPLAEFWLRQGKNLDGALETFKGALRQGSDHSRWAMRIAQTYIARGWKKEGIKLLKNALADPALEPELQREGSVLLNATEPYIDGSP